jgi:hypothetical protein
LESHKIRHSRDNGIAQNVGIGAKDYLKLLVAVVKLVNEGAFRLHFFAERIQSFGGQINIQRVLTRKIRQSVVQKEQENDSRNRDDLKRPSPRAFPL